MIRKILVILFLFPVSVSANYLSYDCNKLKTSNDIICSIKGYSKNEISAIHFEYEIESLTLKDTKIYDFLGELDEKYADLYTDNNKGGYFDIIDIYYETKKDNYKLNIKNVVFYDKNFKEIKINNVKNMQIENKKKKKIIYNIIKYGIIILIGTTIFILRRRK